MDMAEHSPFSALLKTIGLQYAEIISETGGALFKGIGRLSGKLSHTVLQKTVGKTTTANIEKILKEVSKKFPNLNVLKKYGYDGVIEESMEERLGDVIKFALNLDDEEGYSFEQLLHALCADREQ